MLPEDPHHIIAIGASAGGMEEITSFFEHTPTDGVAYVIVQHLSPDYQSRMAEVVSRHSQLIVKEAENGMPVHKNQVYTIPSNKFMTIRDGRLYLTDKDKTQGPHLTINRFLNSLAADSGTKAIAVILSGLGSDGTEGVKNIKKEGGMVMARNPETAEFASMPSCAIATGIVDFILEPELMPDTIMDYVKLGAEYLYDSKDDEKHLASIVDLIKQKLPLDFTDYKQATILRRIKRRAAYNKFSRLIDYIEFLKKTPGEIDTLAQDFLISVTAFFRDKEAFDFLESDILPAIINRLAPDEELKVWVAGCATGEEAYSIAILLREQLTGDLKNTVVKIFATDIDTLALHQAGKGIYDAAIEKVVSAERLELHFLKEGDNYKVCPEIRKMVIFAQHDMVKNPPYCNMHFISCRNMLIYMTPALQKKIFLMLLFGLKMEGYLFLGSSENPLPIIQNLDVINRKWKIYKNLEEKRVVRFDAFSLPQIKITPSTFSKEETFKKTNNTLAEAVNENLVNQFDSLAVCLDENNHVIKTYGDTTRYLLQKNFATNLTDLLPRPLTVAFNTLSAKALNQNEKVTTSGIKIKKGDSIIKVSLTINPLLLKKGEPKLLLVTFREDNPADAVNQNEIVFDEKIYLDQYTLNLEEELRELKERLHSTLLQLDASSENMQSFNEELLSANEEMQSTNEEMQSINEELHTINADYQLKNKELIELNDDLNNYFRSNINGQLFVNNDLQLMKYSPGTVKQINLQPSDIGRPLSNISTNIKFETLIKDIKQVITDGIIITKEIETENGKWYQVMTMPYIQLADNKSAGAIITFNDITELKQTQLDLDKKNESLTRINEDLDNFVHTASHDLLAPLGNIELSISAMNNMKGIDPNLSIFLGIINGSVKKFRALINDISNVAKLESGRLNTELVDIEEIINNIEWSLDDQIKFSGVVIKRDLEVKHILFSKKNFRSILYNLVSNAIKFKSSKPPVLNIHTEKEEDNIILSVEDNGIGMNKGDIDKIFEMYGRLHHDTEGNGIGLYLAKKLIDAEGGNIIVESEPGKGTKFSIYFKLNRQTDPGVNYVNKNHNYTTHL